MQTVAHPVLLWVCVYSELILFYRILYMRISLGYGLPQHVSSSPYITKYGYLQQQHSLENENAVDKEVSSWPACLYHVETIIL